MTGLGLGGDSVVAVIVVLVIILLLAASIAWAICRRQPRSLRMKVSRWLSFEAEWSDDDQDKSPHGDRPAA
jgi:hypothetical protein